MLLQPLYQSGLHYKRIAFNSTCLKYSYSFTPTSVSYKRTTMGVRFLKQRGQLFGASYLQAAVLLLQGDKPSWYFELEVYRVWIRTSSYATSLLIFVSCLCLISSSSWPLLIVVITDNGHFWASAWKPSVHIDIHTYIYGFMHRSN
jgi:hypothetical protein